MIAELNEDFKDFIKLLCKYKVQFIIVGGYAVNYYGYLRATGDIDFAILSNEEEINKLNDVLKEFTGIKIDSDLKYGEVFQIGRPPHRIDLLTSIDGISIHEAYTNSKVLETVEGWDVRIITLEDLIKNKKASGRDKDKVDVNRLQTKLTAT
ncbi:MAG: nucleotidyltransferase [Spirochaetaceae bacterium]|jgi:predicted nucleotidyltransferase|nr:nucleotidyltransferase [Spirochaetaceae bacterium]